MASLLALLLLFIPYAKANISAHRLTCEYLTNPMGLDAASPRFGWILESPQRNQTQTAYRILVASSEHRLESDTGDKWDSGKVESDRSVNVPYQGKPLSSGEKSFWKVRVWDKDGHPSDWSQTATFEMGLLKASDWQGEWIAKAPLLRKSFDITDDVKRSRLYISGIGWFELYINGRKVGDHVLDPAMTDYKKHVLYVTHDVTPMLRRGHNSIAVMLGNGYYSQPGKLRYGTAPQLLVQMNIEYAGGGQMSIHSSDKWRSADGPITRNGIQDGESYDARLETTGWAQADFDDSHWPHALKTSPPGGDLRSQVMPPIKVVETRPAEKLTQPKPSVYVYDLGQVFTGWARIHVRGPRGSTIAIKYSERIFADTGLLDKTNHPAPAETDYYTLKGTPAGEVFEPRFTFHTFRYVQIEDYPGVPKLSDIEGRVVHSAVDTSMTFASSNPLLNKIHKITAWTIANALYGMPMDEPHREPFPYLEAGETPANLYSRRFMPQLWTKWLRDVQDEQTADGAIPVCIPNYPSHKAFDAAWSGNYPPAVWYLYQYYDDLQMLEQHYESMKRWTDYLTTVAGKDHLMMKGTWGDHMMASVHPGEDQYLSPETPAALCWTGYYYRDVAIISQAAKVLGKQDDAERFGRLAEEIRDAFNNKWLNSEKNQYASGSQTSNLFALALGAVPEANRKGVAANAAKDIIEKYNGHLHTGIIGTAAMMEALTANGYGNAMYDLINKTGYPGWGYMVAQGATTIWEAWGHFMASPRRGETMSMFATIDEFFYGDLGGIKGPSYYGPGLMEPGFKDLHIQPFIPDGLEHAEASIETVRGRISTSWRRAPTGLTLSVTIPANTRAAVGVPSIHLGDVVVEESGKAVWKGGAFVNGVPGISNAAAGDEYVTFQVGSGSYSFRLTGNRKSLR